MIKSYLEKVKKELFDERDMLEREFLKLQNRILEIDRFAEILEGESDSNYNTFTPRTNYMENVNKLRELKEEKREIDIKISKNRNDFQINANRQKEIDEIVDYIQRKKIEMEREKELYIAEKNKYFSDEVEKMEEIIVKIESAVSYMEIDRNRSKIEMENYLPQLKDGIEKMKMSLNEKNRDVSRETL